MKQKELKIYIPKNLEILVILILKQIFIEKTEIISKEWNLRVYYEDDCKDMIAVSDEDDLLTAYDWAFKLMR